MVKCILISKKVLNVALKKNMINTLKQFISKLSMITDIGTKTNYCNFEIKQGHI